MIPQKGVQTASGKTMLSLEDYKLQPGDVVSIYATARDARNTARTDMIFIEAQPYERNYMQSQQMGGGAGGGDQDENRISQRQKEIISATWNEIRGGSKDKFNSAENARFLAEVQTKLKEQAQSLAQRARSRQLAGANQEFQSFVKDMEEAANQMGPASDKLKAQAWKGALEPEQKALQHLLRAEATFRDIQVAFGNQRGGGGGSAGRDLANLFDLELDTEKNQYETGQQQSSAEQRQKDVDEALQRLQQLARRQQELAQQQSNSKQQTFEQRWQQEMLRREAEELKKQMEQLSRQASSSSQSSSQGQQNSQSSSGQPSAGQQGRTSSNPLRRNSPNDQRLQQALDRLRQAADDMRSAQQAAAQNGQRGQTEANARRAAERLQEARDMLNGMRRQEASSQLGDLSERADRLAQQQRDFSNRLRNAFGNQLTQDPRRGSQPGGTSRQQAEQLANEKDKMAAELDQLEKDMQKAARDLAGTQPGAASHVRDGLSDIQQNEAKMRMKYSANWIRQGQGGFMVPREAPVTEALDKLSDDLKQAQNALNNSKQGVGQNSDLERSLARVERLRSQMSRMEIRADNNRAASNKAASNKAASKVDNSVGRMEDRSARTAGAVTSAAIATGIVTVHGCVPKAYTTCRIPFRPIPSAPPAMRRVSLRNCARCSGTIRTSSARSQRWSGKSRGWISATSALRNCRTG
ncbi:MAG: hypothetical protein DMG59_05500 [Acidobacteria bacterium]|nr:MAG: hypothetical protein DMG59_05500 [Acidobacteriota bacterium]